MQQITVAAVGYGLRGEAYCDYTLKHESKMKVVAVADPDPVRRALAAKKYGIPAERQYASFEAFLAAGKIADCAVDATMDELHVATAIPLLEAGYDLLLEKPVCNNAADLMRVLRAAKRSGRRLIVCHVLRYTPFYKAVKQIILSGEIGRVRHMQTAEFVGVGHASVGYVRGKWKSRAATGSSYLLAKCCHDLDLLCWFNEGIAPVYAASLGTRDLFVPENAPAGAGERCTDCAAEEQCIYSAKKLAAPHNPFLPYIWPGGGKNLSMEEKFRDLAGGNPHGVCAYKAGSDLIDQQTVILTFENGSMAVHDLVSAVARPGRTLHIVGTLGEIEGFFETSTLKVRVYDPVTFAARERTVPVDTELFNEGHGGGDFYIMEDLCSVLSGQKPSVSCSAIEDSINGHLAVYAADLAMEERRVVAVSELRREEK